MDQNIIPLPQNEFVNENISNVSQLAKFWEFLKSPKGKIIGILLFFFIAGITVIIVVFGGRQTLGSHAAESKTPHGMYYSTGGFFLDTPEKVSTASNLGLNMAFFYGHPPLPTDSLTIVIKQKGMGEIDAFFSSNLYYHECHRAWTQTNHPEYCSKDYRPYLDTNAFIASISAHLHDVSSNYPMVKGFWVLDDQPIWDHGYAKNLLQKIKAEITKEGLSIPTICGFGSELEKDGGYTVLDDIFKDYSPQGCDFVGLYIYSASQSTKQKLPSITSFDWTMKSLLSHIFTQLKSFGWSNTISPIIGIAQGMGGPRQDISNAYELVPTISTILTQSMGFCESGAVGILYYADNTYSHTLWSDSTIAQGIKNGVNACNVFWGVPNPTPHMSPTITPTASIIPTPTTSEPTGFTTVSPTQKNSLQGDINGDGTLNVLDYQILISCFEDKATSSICLDPNKDRHDKSRGLYSDLNNDGIVDGVDYNILIRAFIQNSQ